MCVPLCVCVCVCVCVYMGFPGGSVVKNPPANAGDAGDMTSRRHDFDPWVEKIPWRRKWQLAPVFLPGESQARGVQWAIPMGSQESDMTE